MDTITKKYPYGFSLNIYLKKLSECYKKKVADKLKEIFAIKILPPSSWYDHSVPPTLDMAYKYLGRAHYSLSLLEEVVKTIAKGTGDSLICWPRELNAYRDHTRVNIKIWEEMIRTLTHA